MAKRYGPGDKVFAKVRGYPPWPARVEGVADETPNKMKYHVFFYGTRETAICKSEELYSYLENREKYGKPMKKRGFNEGIAQIEMELGLTPRTNLSVTPSTTPSITSGDNTYDSDAGEGNLVIDETPLGSSQPKKIFVKSPKSINLTSSIKPTKGVKRKLETDGNDETPPVKIKGPSVSHARKSFGTPQTEASKVSPVDNPVTSRSGRKIKPKKFADEGGDDASNSPASYQGSDNNSLPNMQPSVKLSVLSPSINLKSKKTDDTNNDMKRSGSIMLCDQELIESVSDEFITAVTPGGQEVEIEVFVNKPTSFKNDKVKLQWKADAIKKAHEMKGKIESGEIIPKSVNKDVEVRHQARQKMIEEVSKSCSEEDKNSKLIYLRVEAQLLDIDINIKSSLNLIKPDPDVCLRHLDELLDLHITPLMLKKHPEVVETVKKLKQYVGNVKCWKMTDEEEMIFSSKAAMIRSKADHIYNKFKTLFAVPQGKSFREAFANQLLEFGNKTKRMELNEIFGLTQDPVPAVENGSVQGKKEIEIDSNRDTQ